MLDTGCRITGTVFFQGSGIRHPASNINLQMKKIQRYCTFLFLGLALSAQAQMFEFSARDAAKLPNRKLIVIMQEEEPEMVNRIKRDSEKLARYRALITYSNNLLKKTVTKFWKASEPVEFRTLKECLAIADTSQAYYTLEFSSLRLNENTQLHYLKADTNNMYGLRRELMRRKEFGFLELRLIEKLKSAAFYTFYTPSSAPNEYDFITGVQFISALVKEKLAEPKFSTRDYELKIQQANRKLYNRILLADSNVVNKQGKSYHYIREEYDSLSLYELSDPKGISEKVQLNDTLYAYLNIVPYVDPIARGQSFLGTSGGNINDYEKTIYYMQLVIDANSGALIYYDKAEESVVIVRDWKRFLRYSRESTPFLQNLKNNQTQNPNNQVNPSPQQKYYQNQYQQNNQY